ncbi:MAG: RHS repeat-associated core domain-containing protein [Nitrososphaerales archaeon]
MNELTKVKTSSWTANMNYNRDGGLKSMTNDSVVTNNYYYDFENRFTSMTLTVLGGTETLQNNTYDGNGNRVEQTAGGSTTVSINQGSNIIYEKNLTSGVVTDHFYANAMQVGKISGSSLYYYQQDNLGSTRLVTNSLGSTIFSSDYLPFGLNYGLSGSESFMYTGKQFDPSTGLYYYGARFYDDVLGRFITEDTNTGSREDPQSLNRYIYARDNPMSLVDPSGHMFTTLSGNTYSTQAPQVMSMSTVVTTTNVQSYTSTSTSDSLGPNGMVATTTSTTTTVYSTTQTTTTSEIQGSQTISSSSSSVGSSQAYSTTTTSTSLIGGNDRSTWVQGSNGATGSACSTTSNSGWAGSLQALPSDEKVIVGGAMLVFGTIAMIGILATLAGAVGASGPVAPVTGFAATMVATATIGEFGFAGGIAGVGFGLVLEGAYNQGGCPTD